MSRDNVIRWWPLVGLTGLMVLGLAVGEASTRVDDVFIRAGEENSYLGRLLLFTDPRVLCALWAIVLGVALYRRKWSMTAVIVVTPLVAVIAERVCKPLFGRDKDGALAYPSGHTTLAVVVLGLAVLVAGWAAWAVVGAGVCVVLGLLGQSFTYHYFTDTIGGVFLGTALLCLAIRAAGLDRCQPRCDARHTDG